MNSRARRMEERMDQALAGASRIAVAPQSTGFGAEITGLDLSQQLSPATLAEVKSAWAAHSVVAFPDQPLSLEAL